MNAVTVAECSRCGRAAFPQPALCPVCANDEWRTVDVEDAVVQAVTSRRSTNGETIYLAEVRTAPGPVMVVRCGKGTERGAVVGLRQERGGVRAVQRPDDE